jgi:Cu-processing system ATP-binding protein
MISIQNLQKSFTGNEVLKGIDLDFDRPGITAILGPNGSGKTTLIKCILGMVIPTKGAVNVNGQNVKGNWEYRSQIGYLPQIAQFPDNLTVGELIAMIRDIRGDGAAEGPLIELFELEPFLDKRLGKLSGGTKQKVNLVLALMYDSPILILDEPTSGLDPVALLHFKEFINAERQKGKTILITTHIMSLVEEIADEIVFLLEGNIYFRGRMQELNEKYGGENLEKAIAGILMGERKNGTRVREVGLKLGVGKFKSLGV